MIPLHECHPKFQRWFAAQSEDMKKKLQDRWDKIDKSARYASLTSLLRECSVYHGYDFTP
jgi:hypothetical protein